MSTQSRGRTLPAPASRGGSRAPVPSGATSSTYGLVAIAVAQEHQRLGGRAPQQAPRERAGQRLDRAQRHERAARRGEPRRVRVRVRLPPVQRGVREQRAAQSGQRGARGIAHGARIGGRSHCDQHSAHRTSEPRWPSLSPSPPCRHRRAMPSHRRRSARMQTTSTEALARGFVHVESGPLVRSSYHAHEQADAFTQATR